MYLFLEHYIILSSASGQKTDVHNPRQTLINKQNIVDKNEALKNC